MHAGDRSRASRARRDGCQRYADTGTDDEDITRCNGRDGGIFDDFAGLFECLAHFCFSNSVRDSAQRFGRCAARSSGSSVGDGTAVVGRGNTVVEADLELRSVDAESVP